MYRLMPGPGEGSKLMVFFSLGLRRPRLECVRSLKTLFHFHHLTQLGNLKAWEVECARGGTQAASAGGRVQAGEARGLRDGWTMRGFQSIQEVCVPPTSLDGADPAGPFVA